MIIRALAVAFVVTLLLIPVLRRIGIHLRLVARPSDARWHRKPTPTLGGIGIFLGAAAGLVVSGAWAGLHGSLLLAPALIFLLGLYDDVRPLSPTAKLLGQILAASALLFFGYSIDFFAWIPLNVLLTFVWLVAITNAINLLDNMDGLAGGVSLIAAGFLAYFFWDAGDPALAAVALVFVGVLAAFLIFNFPPASIFMGDSGSLFLGFSVATLALIREPRASNVFAVMGPPILLLLLPILDTVLVAITRILRGESPVEGGRDHTSHRLVAFGLPERQTVLVLYGIAIVAGIAATALERLDYELSLVLIPILLISLALLGAYLARLEVAPAKETAASGAITQVALDLTFKRRVLEVGLDFLLIGLAYYLAFWTQLGFVMPTGEALEGILRTLPVALGVVMLAYFLLGVYRGVWRYVGVEDLVRYLAAVLTGAVLSAAAVSLLFPSSPASPAVFFLFGVFLFLSLVGTRFSFRLLDRIYGGRPIEHPIPVLIYGAGDRGVMALQWFMRDSRSSFRPVGFIDDDPLLHGRRIYGLEVLGSLAELEVILADQQIEGIIVAPDDEPEGFTAQALRETLGDRGIWIRKLRLELEPIEGS